MFEITWAGDVLLAERSQPSLDKHGYDWPFEFLRPVLAANFVIGNAEGPITTRTEPCWPQRPYNYNADPRSAIALAEAGFNAMSLCNNHALDRGVTGLVDSQTHLQAAGIRPFGAGLDAVAAQDPVLIETPYGPIAVVGFGQRFRHGQAAAPGVPGTLAMSDEAIPRAHRRALTLGARWVVAFVHWGGTYRPVTDQQRQRAGQFDQAGYNLVVGHGPHIIQPVEVIAGMPVLYSLGNCAFGSYGRFDKYQVPALGLIARTRWDDSGLIDIEFVAIDTDNRAVEFQPRQCGPAGTARARAELGSDLTGHTLLSFAS
jgi:poly-gamma-glutamate capsule biosynthesis protein CapA/YwtB (metallophosphatase superfamily)